MNLIDELKETVCVSRGRIILAAVVVGIFVYFKIRKS